MIPKRPVSRCFSSASSCVLELTHIPGRAVTLLLSIKAATASDGKLHAKFTSRILRSDPSAVVGIHCWRSARLGQITSICSCNPLVGDSTIDLGLGWAHNERDCPPLRGDQFRQHRSDGARAQPDKCHHSATPRQAFPRLGIGSLGQEWSISRPQTTNGNISCCQGLVLVCHPKPIDHSPRNCFTVTVDMF